MPQEYIELRQKKTKKLSRLLSGLRYTTNFAYAIINAILGYFSLGVIALLLLLSIHSWPIILGLVFGSVLIASGTLAIYDGDPYRTLFKAFKKSA